MAYARSAMKTFRYCMACALFAASILLAGSAAGQDFYPLQRGNSWLYRSIGGDSTVYSTVRVVGESTFFANGRRYFELDSGDVAEGRFVRKDSISVYHLEPSSMFEYTFFPLTAQVGDTVLVDWQAFLWVTVESIDTIPVFGAPRTVRTYKFDGLLMARLRLCDGLGPLSEWRYTDTGYPWPESGRELIGCTIGGVDYGVRADVPEVGQAPSAYRLRQNFPNPFNPETRISYSLPMAEVVSLVVYDLLGREVAHLVDGKKEPGSYSVAWNAAGLPSGVYVCRMTAGEYAETKKMLLLR